MNDPRANPGEPEKHTVRRTCGLPCGLCILLRAGFPGGSFAGPGGNGPRALF